MPPWLNRNAQDSTSPIPNDVDPAETAEWLESLDYVLERKGPERVQQLLTALDEARDPQRRRAAVHRHHAVPQHDPARQAAALSRQPRAGAAHQELHPLERDGDGHARQPRLRRPRRPHLHVRLVGHAVRSRASTTSSAAAAKTATSGDQIYFQGHASPGMYARAFLEGRLTEQNLINFRRELQPRRRPVVLPAPLADARVLGIPHRVDGPGADHGHLPGPVQPLPHRPRHHRPLEASTSGPSWATASATSPRRSAPSRSPRASSSTT